MVCSIEKKKNNNNVSINGSINVSVRVWAIF